MGKKGSIKFAGIGFIVGALFFSGISYAAGGNTFKIVQNGIDKTPTDEDLKPFVQNGRVYVPVRTVANLLDVPIEYDNASKTVTLGEKLSGTRVKNVSSYDGNIVGISHSDNIGINKVIYNSPSLIVHQDTQGVGIIKLNLDGKYKKFSFSLGMTDSSRKGLSVNITFKDDTGKVLDQQQIGYGGLAEGKSIDVANVNQLVIEIETTQMGIYNHYTAIINPILQ